MPNFARALSSLSDPPPPPPSSPSRSSSVVLWRHVLCLGGGEEESAAVHWKETGNKSAALLYTLTPSRRGMGKIALSAATE